MRRNALAAVLILAVAACSSANTAGTTTTTEPLTTTTAAVVTTSTTEPAFPVAVSDDFGSVTVEARPTAIISLSSTATEMLFAIGAGDQIVAVDDQSNYPAEAPMTDLSGFAANLEAILSYGPDLVVIQFDPGDLVAGLQTAGVPVLVYGAAFAIEDVYRQLDGLGTATGNEDGASTTGEEIRSGLEAAVSGATDAGVGITYYHEIDALLYTATSSTFFGEIYGLFGMENIADEADKEGSAFGYPQLSAEYIVASDPNLVFLGNVLYGESSETVMQRPGWDVMTAVKSGDIVELDSDIASRWGPRIVEFAAAIAAALEDYGTS